LGRERNCDGLFGKPLIGHGSSREDANLYSSAETTALLIPVTAVKNKLWNISHAAHPTPQA